MVPPPFEPMPETPAANPRDVAALFGLLDIEHLKYREFQRLEDARDAVQQALQSPSLLAGEGPTSEIFAERHTPISNSALPPLTPQMADHSGSPAVSADVKPASAMQDSMRPTQQQDVGACSTSPPFDTQHGHSPDVSPIGRSPVSGRTFSSMLAALSAGLLPRRSRQHTRSHARQRAAVRAGYDGPFRPRMR